MAEVEFGFPGPVQYSYVHVRGTEEELKNINYEMLGAAFTYALASSRVGMNDAKDLIDNKAKKPQAPASEPVEHKVGDKVTVGGTEFTKIAEPEDLIKELGATEIQDVNEPVKLKPWEKPKPKATGGTVVDVDFF